MCEGGGGGWQGGGEGDLDIQVRRHSMSDLITISTSYVWLLFCVCVCLCVCVCVCVCVRVCVRACYLQQGLDTTMYSRTVSQRVQGLLRGFHSLNTVHHESRVLSTAAPPLVWPPVDDSRVGQSSISQRRVTWCQRRTLHLSMETFAARAKNAKKKTPVRSCVG